jgi:hypothetical protein
MQCVISKASNWGAVVAQWKSDGKININRGFAPCPGDLEIRNTEKVKTAKCLKQKQPISRFEFSLLLNK